MKVYELAKAVEPYVIEMRRYFHEHPELSNHEDKTIERLCEELDKMGISYEVVPHGGIIGYIEGAKPGKTVLLRADWFRSRRTTWPRSGYAAARTPV